METVLAVVIALFVTNFILQQTLTFSLLIVRKKLGIEIDERSGFSKEGTPENKKTFYEVLFFSMAPFYCGSFLMLGLTVRNIFDKTGSFTFNLGISAGVVVAGFFSLLMIASLFVAIFNRNYFSLCARLHEYVRPHLKVKII